MKMLMVLTSHDQLGDTGKKTGFWLEEFAAPYYVFKDAGADVALASPKGGQPPLDPMSDSEDAQTDATKRFKLDKAAQQDLASTQVLSSVDADGFDANENLSYIRDRVRLVTKGEAVRGRVDERLHGQSSVIWR